MVNPWYPADDEPKEPCFSDCGKKSPTEIFQVGWLVAMA